MRNSGCLFDMRLILCRWLKNDQHSREMLPACSQEYLQREFVTNNTHYLHHNMLGQGSKASLTMNTETTNGFPLLEILKMYQF